MIKIESKQILMPKQVYIGDKAELRVTFPLNSDLAKKLQTKKTLSTEFFDGNLDFNICEIKSITVSPEGQDKAFLQIQFTAWKTGLIQLPEYNLSRALAAENSIHNINKDTDLAIHFEPVEIVSLIGTEENIPLKAEASPLLIPGTSYIIYVQVISAALIIILAIRMIIKHKAIALFFKNQRLLRKYKKNRRSTEKKLEALIEKNPSDHDFAETIQQIMRNYLEVRLEAPFTHSMTSELGTVFAKATLNLLPQEKEDAFYEIIPVFVRTDYIRYGKENKFNPGERNQIIEGLLKNISILENTKIQKKEDAGATLS